MEQRLGRDVEGFEEPEQSGEADLAYAAFDPADLDRGEAGGVGEVFLGPAALEAGGADVCPELLDI